MKNIKIVTVKYFGEIEDSDFNGTVFYQKYGNRYIARFYVDFFWRRIYIPKKQPKYYKALVGLEQSLEIYYFPQKK